MCKLTVCFAGCLAHEIVFRAWPATVDVDFPQRSVVEGGTELNHCAEGA